MQKEHNGTDSALNVAVSDGSACRNDAEELSDTATTAGFSQESTNFF